MRHVRRDALGGALAAGAAFRTRLRLFGLLALLIPLFAGLQHFVREAVPRIEIRLVSQDVPTSVSVLVPIEVPVDRVVERIVYVPVDRPDTVPPLNAPANLPDAIFQPAPPAQLPATEAGVNRESAPPAEPLAAAPGPASDARAPAVEPAAAPTSALIATGTYRPQPAAPARAAVTLVAEATDDTAGDDEFIADSMQSDDGALSPESAGDAVADDGVEWVDVPVMVAVLSPSGDGTSEMSVEMMTVARPRATEAVQADEGSGDGADQQDEPMEEAAALLEEVSDAGE
jgi:hypothetical protein